ELGHFDTARSLLEDASARAAVLPASSAHTSILVAARYERSLAVGEGLEDLATDQSLVSIPENTWTRAAIQAAGARIFAWLGQPEAALAFVGAVTSPLDAAPGWAPNYPMVACDAAEALWMLQSDAHIGVVERALIEKVVGPELPYVLRDGRRSL